MKSFDRYNKDYLIDMHLERIRDINNRIRSNMYYYKKYLKIAENERYRDIYTEDANIMLNGINNLKTEKERLIQELKDRLEFDYYTGCEYEYDLDISL